MDKRIIAKTASSPILVVWVFLDKLLNWIGNLDTLQTVCKWVGECEKEGAMSPPGFFQTWWFPYLSTASGFLILLLIWRKELAPILARESLWPGWYFWAKFLPRWVFKSKWDEEGKRRVYVQIELGRRCRDETNHDPAEERKTWFLRTWEVLDEYFPGTSPSFMAVHGDKWNEKSHREVLDDEIKWLERFINPKP